MSAFDDQTFELHPEHVTLLRAFNVTWYEIETGAPANRLIEAAREYIDATEGVAEGTEGALLEAIRDLDVVRP